MLFRAAIYLLEARRAEKFVSHSALRWSALAASLVLGTVPFSAARAPWWDKFVALAPAGLLDHHWPIGAGFIRMEPAACWHGAGAVLLLLLVETWPGLRGGLAGKLPRLLGVISFPLYLLHVPPLLSVGCGILLLAPTAGLGSGAAAIMATAMFIPVTIGAATLAARAVEKPAIRIAAHRGSLVQSLGSALLARRSRSPTL